MEPTVKPVRVSPEWQCCDRFLRVFQTPPIWTYPPRARHNRLFPRPPNENVCSATRYGTSRQARAGEGFDKSQFLTDWERHIATCPVGKQSISWLPNTYPNQACDLPGPLVHCAAKHAAEQIEPLFGECRGEGREC
jgi:hypothetical protein